LESAGIPITLIIDAHHIHLGTGWPYFWWEVERAVIFPTNQSHLSTLTFTKWDNSEILQNELSVHLNSHSKTRTIACTISSHLVTRPRIGSLQLIVCHPQLNLQKLEDGTEGNHRAKTRRQNPYFFVTTCHLGWAGPCVTTEFVLLQRPLPHDLRSSRTPCQNEAQRVKVTSSKDSMAQLAIQKIRR